MVAGLTVIRKDSWVPDELKARMRDWQPKSGLGLIVRDCLKYLPVELAAELLDRITSVVVVETNLSLIHLRNLAGRAPGVVDRAVFGEFARDPYRPEARLALADLGYRCEDHGVVARRVVTTAGVGFLVDALQNLVEPELLRYHGIGTGTVAEAVGDTALGAEATTALNPDSTRATGTLAEGAANVYRSVGTNTVDAAVAATEHGVFTQAAVPGGVLLDRSVFAVVNLGAGDSLQSTYDLTLSAGG